ncbi:MAG: S8 family serine peptidase, partial [Candidatus Omnitrophota bacterium]
TGEGESTVDKVVQAIKYAADNGADIINLSWGVPTRWWSPIPSLSNVINYAYAKGCIIVCAAGNNNDDAAYYPPANYANVITVGATTQKNEKCSFSNYGSSIDVVAPGGGYLQELGNTGKDDARNILTTVPQEFSMAQDYENMEVAPGYYRFGGTSSAAPHVAGVCALLKSIDPGLTNKEIETAIEKSADDLGALGKDKIFGYGRVNAYKACQAVIHQETTVPASQNTQDTSTTSSAETSSQNTSTTTTNTATSGLGNLFGGLMGGSGGMGNLLGGLTGGSGGMGNLLGGLTGGSGGMGNLFGGLMGGNTANSSSATSSDSTANVGGITHITHNGMHIWYPNNKQGGPYPLVVFSHGAVTGMPTHCPYLTQGLSEHGYVTCAIKHSETKRPQEVQGEIDEMLHLNSDLTSPLYGMIDENAIGVCGHSMGGWTTGVICGAGTEQQADRRVKAGFCLEPYNMTIKFSLNNGQIFTPMMFVFGTQDFLAPASSNKFVYDNAPAPKYCAIVSGLGHIGAAFGSTGANAVVGKYALAFFDRYLKDDLSANQTLQTQDPAFASYEYLLNAGTTVGTTAGTTSTPSNSTSANGWQSIFTSTPESDTTGTWQETPAYGPELENIGMWQETPAYGPEPETVGTLEAEETPPYSAPLTDTASTTTTAGNVNNTTSNTSSGLLSNGTGGLSSLFGGISNLFGGLLGGNNGSSSTNSLFGGLLGGNSGIGSLGSLLSGLSGSGSSTTAKETAAVSESEDSSDEESSAAEDTKGQTVLTDPLTNLVFRLPFIGGLLKKDLAEQADSEHPDGLNQDGNISINESLSRQLLGVDPNFQDVYKSQDDGHITHVEADPQQGLVAGYNVVSWLPMLSSQPVPVSLESNSVKDETKSSNNNISGFTSSLANLLNRFIKAE